MLAEFWISLRRNGKVIQRLCIKDVSHRLALRKALRSIRMPGRWQEERDQHGYLSHWSKKDGNMELRLSYFRTCV
jgi:hypothetical protein